jgi:hypothetical protein
VDRISVRAVERLAGFVAKIEGANGVFQQIRSEAHVCDDGVLEVIAIDKPFATLALSWEFSTL